MLISQADLLRYAQNGYNVLLEGKHGIGKTEIIKALFESMGYKVMYFSASTLDPWVDLIGVPQPKDVKAKHGQELSLVRPEWIYQKIDAIFFDELNRAQAKVLNAVMELIQFGSINGFKLPHLKVVWAAINPWDDDNTYQVSELDPALIDRFQVKINVPYKVDEEWFVEKYPETGRTFCGWWKGLEDDIKNLISPRRLSYAADAYSKGLKFTDILTPKANLKKLRDDLVSIPFLKKIEGLKSEEQVKAFLSNVNNVTDLLELIRDQNARATQFLSKYRQYVSKEIVEASLPETPKKKQNHELTEKALELLLRNPLDNFRFVFDKAAELFTVESLFQLDLLTTPTIDIQQIILKEVNVYKAQSKAAQERIAALTNLSMSYVTKLDVEAFDAKADDALIALITSLMLADGGQHYTRERVDFLIKKLGSGGHKSSIIIAVLKGLYA